MSYRVYAIRGIFQPALYSEDPYEETRRRPRGPRRGSGARGTYNKNRVDDERLKKKLFLGIKDDNGFALFKTFQLTITTRQIGFGTTQIFMALREFNNIPAAGTLYQMYRVFLAVAQVKVIMVNRGVTNLQLHSSDFQAFEPDEALVVAAKSVMIIPQSISLMVNAIGVVSTNDRKYVPGFGRNNYIRGVGRFIPQSEQITYSNLRNVVVALADVNTPAEYRRRFYRNNPIPGAIWANGPDNPTLINADEISPAGYNIENLLGDIEDINTKLNFMARKAPEYFPDRVKYEVEGTKAMLTCNEQGTLKIVDRNPGEDLAEYQARVRLNGDTQNFWNLEKLTHSEMINGALGLMGELPGTAELQYPVYILRNRAALD